MIAVGGRKQPEFTDNERRSEYRRQEKRGFGEKVAGDLAEDLDEKGGAGDVRREREEWRKKHGSP